MSTHHGYILIADITGYTSYLSRSELDHAQQTLTALLNVLIRQTRPPLIISRTAGDAVISYGLREGFFQGQTFVELIEATYVAFRKALDRMVLNTTCRCNACRNISSLDLKFFVHYGAFGIQQLDTHPEMIGTDVNIAHRLLKNTVTERTGIRAYAFYSQAAIDQLNLQVICGRMTPHAESYEHIGEVQAWIQDLHPIWDEGKNRNRLEIPADKVLMAVSTLVPASPERVWDFLVVDEDFNVFAAGTKTVTTGKKDGFITEGSVYQCYHGDSILPLTVLEWSPFERIVIESTSPLPLKGATLLMEIRLDPEEQGTRFTQVFGRAQGPWLSRNATDLVFRSMVKSAQRDVESFRDHIVSKLSGRDGRDLPAVSAIES